MAAADLARYRGTPCLLFVSGSLIHRGVLTIREALGNMRGDQLDVIVASPGGRSESAYLVTRELRRRFTQLYAPLLGQVDPARLADSTRGLGAGLAYAERVLRRYRPALYTEQGETLLRRLIHEYPTHGFVLDREELEDVGLPSRLPDATETPLLDQFALALLAFGTQADLIELISGSDHAPTRSGAASRRVRQSPARTHAHTPAR